MTKSSENEKRKSEHSTSPRRVRIVTVLAIEHTVGDPYDENVPIVDGDQMVTVEEIAHSITSDQTKILAKLMIDAFSEFSRRFPDSKPSAQIVPANGIEGVEPILIEAE